MGNTDKEVYILQIDVEDRYAEEMVRKVQALRQLDSDAIYWTHRSLTFTNQYGQKNTIDIYPLTPFLAMGEEIIWQSPKANINDKKKKVVWIDAVTNHRVFQYSYEEHKDAVILFPSVEDVKITNEARGAGLRIYNTTSPYLTGIQASGATGIVGDIVIYSQGTPWITFTQVNDPETLSNVLRSFNQQQSNVLVTNGETGPNSRASSS